MFFAVTLSIAVVIPAYALNVEKVSNPRRLNETWVTDKANIVSTETEKQLRQKISCLEARNAVERLHYELELLPPIPPKNDACLFYKNWLEIYRRVTPIVFLIVFFVFVIWMLIIYVKEKF